MKIAFLWDGVWRYGKQWQDGLWQALKRLETDHKIAYFEPDQEDKIVGYQADVILFWGALSESVKEKVVSYPGKKAICFAGGPIETGNVDGFDLYFTESAINEDELEKLGKPWLRAFGVNELIFKPMKLTKRYDAMIAGTFALWKRHELFAESVGKSGIAVGIHQSHELQCVEVCQQHGVKVQGEVKRGEVALLINQSKTVLNTADFWGGGQRLTLEAMACNVPPIVMQDSPKNCEIVGDAGYGWICEPNPEAIKKCLKRAHDTPQSELDKGREYVMSKYTSKHYAKALKKGLESL